MKKELLTIEFRYHVKLKNENSLEYRNKTITIGIFDSIEDAIIEGNKAIDVLSKRFEVRYDDRFKLNHLFGYPKKLVTNTCYPTKGIEYFAKITSLEFNDLNTVLDEIFRTANK
jgi:hypothetical protein